MDPIEKAKASTGPLTRKLTGLPGIKGYRDKEMRRDSDKLVRDRLVHELETRRDRLDGLGQELLTAGGLLLMDDLQGVIVRLQTLIDRIRTAAYGYAGFFDLQRVQEPELERLAEYDQSLFDSLPTLDTAIADFEKAVRANDNVQAALPPVTGAVNEIADKFARRHEVMVGS